MIMVAEAVVLVVTMEDVEGAEESQVVHLVHQIQVRHLTPNHQKVLILLEIIENEVTNVTLF
jgi:hypothetical protein